MSTNPEWDPWVDLSEWEYLLCHQAATLRQVENFVIGRANTNKLAEDFVKNLEIHVTGCCAEMATASYFEVYPRSLFSFRATDVAGHEVKGTNYEKGNLVVQAIHAQEGKDKKFILVCGNGRAWSIKGWMTGAEVLDHPLEARVPGRPAHWVPQYYLHPIQEINQ